MTDRVKRKSVEGTSPPKTSSKKTKAGNENSDGEKGENVLMWFRTDLRLADNRALEAALECIKKRKKDKSAYLFAFFIVSRGEWKAHDVSNFRVDFLLRNVQKLHSSLKELGVPLIIEDSNDPSEIPETVLSVCKRYSIRDVFFNIEYEVNEAKRDATITALLKSNGVQMEGRHDQCGIKPGEIKAKTTGKPYSVFTPFKNTWLGVVGAGGHLKLSNSLPELSQKGLLNEYADIFNKDPPTSAEGFVLDAEKKKLCQSLYPAGEEEAMKRLEEFATNRLVDYKSKRDFPAQSGTSVLSPYLAAGVISPRQCLARAKEANGGKYSGGKAGIDTWIVELIWRDFYRHVLVAFPRVSKSLPFKKESIGIAWSENESHFQAWCEGKTGYPIVDAGMRQLLSTGWMHNRVRMISAMFLTKDLLLNWQKGEKHFMRHLVDGDLASNNGGWQWSASTGTDAQPYFRIFNPATQSKNFDPEGDYIRKWIPELGSVKDSKAIHDPHTYLDSATLSKIGYPKPIVDHSKQRLLAIDMYAKAYKK